MGVFNSVYLNCPCGGDVEFQAGSDYAVYHPGDSVPADILADLQGEYGSCDDCGNGMAFPALMHPIFTVG